MGLINDIAALAPVADIPSPKSRTLTYGLRIPGAAPGCNGSHRLDVPRWLSDRGIEYTTKPFADGRTGYLLAQCPFDPAHGGSGEVMVAIDAAGKLSAKCFHNSCAGRGWQEFKTAIGEPDGHHYDPPLSPRAPRAETQQEDTLQDVVAADVLPSYLTIRTAGELIRTYPRLRTPVIHGLLRQGETMNCISSPKVGKSWLVAGLSLAIVTGRQWLGYDVERGKVLLVDNELHQQTLGYRIKKVADASGIAESEYADDLHIVTLRGCLTDIVGLGRLLETIAAETYRLVVLDALYRAFPLGTDENSNSAIAQVYNCIDQYALALDCAWCCVHHSSKGNQSNKDVTDVGSGAGSQSRAVDAHVILRPHIEAGCIVLEAAARSWPPIDPVGLRWEWPLWSVDRELDPAALKTDRARRQQVDDSAAAAECAKRILDTFVHFPAGATQRDIRDRVGKGKVFDAAWLSVCNGGDLVECEVLKANRQVYAGFKRVYGKGENHE